MAIIQSGASSTNLLTVDPTFAAARVSEHPPEILGAYMMGMTSGLLTGAPANSVVYAFRWAPSATTNLCMIRRIEVGFATTTAFTAAQTLAYSLQAARSFTASYTTGGTQALFTQTNTGKMRTVMPQSGFVSGGLIQIATTAAMTTTAAFTADTQFMATVNGTTSAVGASLLMAPIFQHQPGDYPLIFAANEGFIINNGQVMGAGGVGNLIVNIEWMELAATTGNAIAY